MFIIVNVLLLLFSLSAALENSTLPQNQNQLPFKLSNSSEIFNFTDTSLSTGKIALIE